MKTLSNKELVEILNRLSNSNIIYRSVRDVNTRWYIKSEDLPDTLEIEVK